MDILVGREERAEPKTRVLEELSEIRGVTVELVKKAASYAGRLDEVLAAIAFPPCVNYRCPSHARRRGTVPFTGETRDRGWNRRAGEDHAAEATGNWHERCA